MDPMRVICMEAVRRATLRQRQPWLFQSQLKPHEGNDVNARRLETEQNGPVNAC